MKWKKKKQCHPNYHVFKQDELNQLTERLDGYTTNQKLLGQTTQLLKSKEEELNSLQEKVASLELEKSKFVLKLSGAKEHKKKIQQLEKQVKELEGVIKKRFPNSLSALVLAANSPSVEESRSDQFSKLELTTSYYTSWKKFFSQLITAISLSCEGTRTTPRGTEEDFWSHRSWECCAVQSPWAEVHWTRGVLMERS